MLKIIISPAKKMSVKDDGMEHGQLPCLLSKTRLLRDYLRQMSYQELKTIWKCNDKIAALNEMRLRELSLEKCLTPAVLAYEGLQYQHMAPAVFETEQWEYIRHHLTILSGFYGVLKADDGVIPYRLEMQAKINWSLGKEPITSLYDFWGSELFERLSADTDVIVNLASKEYSSAVEPYLKQKPQLLYLTCVFGTREYGKEGKPKVKVKATEAKMARGAMVRFMAEHQIEQVRDLKNFNLMGYHFDEELSNETTYTFVLS